MVASRWHSPPNPLAVFTSATGTPVAASRSASMAVSMSPSITPTRSSGASRAKTSHKRVVLPAPGDDITFTTATLAAAKSLRLASAVRSFSPRILSSTSTRRSPDS